VKDSSGLIEAMTKRGHSPSGFTFAIALFGLTKEQSTILTRPGTQREMQPLQMLGLRFHWFRQNFSSSHDISGAMIVYGLLPEGFSSRKVKTNPPVEFRVSDTLGYGVVVGETIPAVGGCPWVVVDFDNHQRAGFRKDYIMETCSIFTESLQNCNGIGEEGGGGGAGAGGDGGGGMPVEQAELLRHPPPPIPDKD
jgi:hypothetical protein